MEMSKLSQQLLWNNMRWARLYEDCYSNNKNSLRDNCIKTITTAAGAATTHCQDEQLKKYNNTEATPATGSTCCYYFVDDHLLTIKNSTTKKLKILQIITYELMLS